MHTAKINLYRFRGALGTLY